MPTFGSATNYPVGGSPNSVAAGDLDHDGIVDFVAASNEALTVWHGTGTGSFNRQQTVPLTAPCTGGNAIAVADLDKDGFQDLLFVGTCMGVRVVRQNPAMPGQFLAEVQVIPGILSIDNIGVGDLNGDTFLDIAVASGGKVFRVYQDSATPGTFAAQATIDVNASGVMISIVDLNEDQRGDIALLRAGRANVLFQSATDGVFGAPAPFGPSNVFGLGAGDVNGDQAEDLLITSSTTGAQLLTQVVGMPGTFQLGSSLTGGGSRLGLADVNDDGRVDVVLEGAMVLQCDAPAPAGQFSTSPISLAGPVTFASVGLSICTSAAAQPAAQARRTSHSAHSVNYAWPDQAQRVVELGADQAAERIEALGELIIVHPDRSIATAPDARGGSSRRPGPRAPCPTPLRADLGPCHGGLVRGGSSAARAPRASPLRAPRFCFCRIPPGGSPRHKQRGVGGARTSPLWANEPAGTEPAAKPKEKR